MTQQDQQKLLSIANMLNNNNHVHIVTLYNWHNESENIDESGQHTEGTNENFKHRRDYLQKKEVRAEPM